MSNISFPVITTIILCCISSCVKAIETAPQKPRVVVLTDYSPSFVEPDDMESMIRLFVHADLVEIEALIGTTGWSSRDYPAAWVDSIKALADLYALDVPKLMKRSGQLVFLPLAEEQGTQTIGYWPSADYLKSRTVAGSRHMGQSFIGADNQNPGSDLIISLADEDDPRPIWVTVWGGANTFAQAVWQVQQTRSKQQLKDFLHKFRLISCTDQDRPLPFGPKGQTEPSFSSQYWLRDAFVDDLLVISQENTWLVQHGKGRTDWDRYETEIQGHGHLGVAYPKFKFGLEGDTPTFLHVLPMGLHDPDKPEQAGWGGYYERGVYSDGMTVCYTDIDQTVSARSAAYYNRFYPAMFNNFAARMQWAEKGTGNVNPVAVVNGMRGLDPILIEARTGGELILDASKSSDPDGNLLSYQWWIQPEAGSYMGEISISGADQPRCSLFVPSDASGKDFHVILELTDGGSPALTAYRRVIVHVN